MKINKEKWYSVEEDGYPEEDQLVYYYFKITGIGKGYHSTWFCEEVCEGGYTFNCFVDEDGSGYLCDDVTHWVPAEWADEL